MREKKELGEKEGKQERGGGRKEGVVRKRVEREGTGGEGKKEQGEKISFTELYSFTHQSLIRMRNVHGCKFYFFLI